MARFKTSLGKPQDDRNESDDLIDDCTPEKNSGDFFSGESEDQPKPSEMSFSGTANRRKQAQEPPGPERRSQYIRPAAKPKMIGRYKVIDELGRGAMAYVYKAYDPEIDRFLAVKVLREELANDDDYRSSFIREAKLAGQLAHPGIVTIYDVGIADEKPYIAMELLDGVPLDVLLKKRVRLPQKFVISVLIQLSRALHYAHKQGVIHRDIKPGNILCLSDNKTAKLTDFGIAQLDDSLVSQGKRQDKVLGTPEYMAPEQVLGQTVDARSDLYSLGILVYAMITGLTPFRADDYGELFRQIIKDKAPDMQIEGASIPDEFQDIVRRLLQKQPDKRYQNAAALMRDTRDMIEVFETDAKAHGKTGFVSLRLKWTLGMAGLVAATMFIGLIVVYYQQSFAMRKMVIDYGYSTGRLIANEVAEPMLLNDKIALDAIIQDVKKNQDVEYVSIRDNRGKVLASTQPNEIAKKFSVFSASNLVDTSGRATVYSREIDVENKVFDIDSQIIFQDRSLGSVWVSVSANELVQSSKTTLMIMLGLMVVTLVAVFSITLAFARKISAQLNKFETALERVRRGQFNRRLTTERNDEFGRVSDTFNQMAEALEKRWDKHRETAETDFDLLEVTKPTGTKATVGEGATVVVETRSRKD